MGGNGLKKIAKSFIIFFSGITAGIVFGVWSTSKKMIKDVADYKLLSDKHRDLFLLMNQWVRVKQRKKELRSYFSQTDIRTIAIYGMNIVGETLLNELKETEIRVLYGIDRNAEGIYTNIDVVLPETDLKDVDAIIVTAVTYFDEIKEFLNKKVKCKVISLEDILYES